MIEMKSYAASDIVSAVRECMDESGVNEAELIGGADDGNMLSTIKSKIADAMRYIFLSADTSLLEPTLKTETATSGGVYSMELPDDFLRLCMISVSGWSHPVFKVIPYDSKEYASLKNAYITGRPDNPKVALSFTDSGGSAKKCLELYSLPEGESLIKMYYMPEPSATSKSGEDYYDIPEKVYRGVVYYTAGLTLLTYKDDHASNLMALAVQMVGGK